MQHRYATIIEDGIIYVDADVGRVEVGPLASVFDCFGTTHEVTYEDWEKERYDISFADEGMELDVRETVEMMTHTKSIVESLKNESLSPDTSETSTSRRMGFFCGMLGFVLDHGPA